MKATYIFVDNRFCITLDDFIDTLNKNKDNIERLSLCIAPLIQDGIIMEWLAYLGETGDQLLKIIKKSIDENKPTEYVIRRIFLELGLAL